MYVLWIPLLCCPTTPGYETCLGVLDVPSVLHWKKLMRSLEDHNVPPLLHITYFYHITEMFIVNSYNKAMSVPIILH